MGLPQEKLVSRASSAVGTDESNCFRSHCNMHGKGSLPPELKSFRRETRRLAVHGSVVRGSAGICCVGCAIRAHGVLF
jgi:hypothetical protein